MYKTSILVFRDRERYVTGDIRFKNSYSKHNPRQMVRKWAEKERRNYERLREAGIRTPGVFKLKQHVLVMEFVGREGVAAPRLKDTELTTTKLRELYTDLVLIMRQMY